MLVTVEQAAAALGISRTAVSALIRTRQLRTVKIGCRRRVPVSALHDYVADLISAAEPT